MATTTQNVGTYTTLGVTNLQSLANDATDPFSGWQSGRVSNVSTLALDYEIIVDLSTANTAGANDKAAYVFLVPWVTTDGGTTWIAGGNFGTTTLPSATDATCSITEPNSMRGPIVLPYKDQQQRMQKAFFLSELIPVMPDGWSLAIRNCSGAALSTGCVVAYRAIKYDVA
jgi:hypothetical protein